MVPPAPNGSRASAGFGLAPVDSTARPQILAIWRQFTERSDVLPIASLAAAPPRANQGRQPGGGPCRSIAFTTSRCLRSSRFMWTATTACSDGMRKAAGKIKPEQDAGHDQNEIEDGRKGLAVQQEAERRKQNCKHIDHRPTSSSRAPFLCGAARAAPQWAASEAGPFLLTCGNECSACGTKRFCKPPPRAPMPLSPRAPIDVAALV